MAESFVARRGRDQSSPFSDVAYTLNCPLRSEASNRLAIVAASAAELDRKLAFAIERLADPATDRIWERSGIHYVASPLAAQGTLAALFPGEGAQYVNMLGDLAVRFPEVREWFDLIDRAARDRGREVLPSQAVFPPPGASAKEMQQHLLRMDCGSEAVFAADMALLDVASRLGIRPRALAGHSTGEYAALYAAGAVLAPRDALVQHVRALNNVYQRLQGEGRIPEGTLLAVFARDRAAVDAVLAAEDGRVAITADNCPSQLILFTAPEMAARITSTLGDRAICTTMPFGRAYHTPHFAPFAEALGAAYRGVAFSAPRIPLYSSATAQPYPTDASAVRVLAVAQWTRPVRFREMIKAMYEDGVRLFVELGPRNLLTGFVQDTLRGLPHVAVAANHAGRPGDVQLAHLLAVLAAHGVPLTLDYLYERRGGCRQDLHAAAEPQAGAGRTIRVASGLPRLQLARASTTRGSDTAPAAPRERGSTVEGIHVGERRVGRAGVLGAYFRTMDEFLAVQRRVMLELVQDNGLGAVKLAAASVAGPVLATAPAEMLVTSANPDRAAGPLALLATEPAPPSTPRRDLAAMLLTLVSERTGHPLAMLEGLSRSRGRPGNRLDQTHGNPWCA